MNSLNVVPIREIYERWVGPFQELWSGELLRIKEIAEKDGRGRKARNLAQAQKTLTSGRQTAVCNHNLKTNAEPTK